MKNFKINSLIIVLLATVISTCSKDDSGFKNAPDSGQGGSLARFTIACNHLYIVDDQDLNVYDISSPDNPVFVKKINIGFGIETIYPYDDYLFIGSSTGMFIYNLVDCSNPQFESEFAHVLSCDPVVAEGNFAYVTLRSGGDCRRGWSTNQLDIIDISDITNPQLLVTHFVEEPWGLGIDSSTLFLCHGEHGLGIYNVMDPYTLDTIKFYSDIKTYDVIPRNDILLVTGASGINQYDYSNIDSIYLLSQIPVGQ